MTTTPTNPDGNYVALGMLAWNEEKSITSTLETLFRQSLFANLARRGQMCEIFCVANGCTDRTVIVASEFLSRQSERHPDRAAFSYHVVDLAERGKVHAWNQFVHFLAAPGARFLFLMDADILLQGSNTLWNMLQALEQDAHASVAVDRPCKDVLFKRRKSISERLSLGASRLTRAAPAQLCGQLYCIRAEVARRIYLPKDLAACEDGFIKALVCTDFLAHPVIPERIRLAEHAEHVFSPYLSPVAVFKNQKRQVLGQTLVHLLIDRYLNRLAPGQRVALAETLRTKDVADPGWLKKLILEHLRHTRFFWQLYPGLLSHRFQSWAALSPLRRLAYLPVVLAGSLLTLAGGLGAWRALKRGCTAYWPKARRTIVPRLSPVLTTDDHG